MKKYDFPTLLHLLGIPAVAVLLGLILLLNPDSAAALVGKILAAVLILVGVGMGYRVFRGNSGSIAPAVVCLVLGIWFSLKPLFLAESIGRILGILLMIRGIRNLVSHWQLTGGKPRLHRGLVISAVTALAGLVLIAMPLTTSRMLFSICGIILICVGCAEGYDRLRGRKYLDEGDDPNIIDAL